MGETTYKVVLDDNTVVGRAMPLEYAMKLTQKIFEDYYNEPNIKVAVIRETKSKSSAVPGAAVTDDTWF